MIEVKQDKRKNQAIKKNLDGNANATRQGIRKAYYQLGKSLVKTSTDLIKSPNKTGRKYWVYVGYTGNRLKRRRLHQASAPGEAPARISGTLIRSLDFFVRGTTELFFGSKVHYAPYLEDKRVLNRQFLWPSIKINEKNARNYFESNIKKYLENR